MVNCLGRDIRTVRYRARRFVPHTRQFVVTRGDDAVYAFTAVMASVSLDGRCRSGDPLSGLDRFQRFDTARGNLELEGDLTDAATRRRRILQGT